VNEPLTCGNAGQGLVHFLLCPLARASAGAASGFAARSEPMRGTRVSRGPVTHPQVNQASVRLRGTYGHVKMFVLGCRALAWPVQRTSTCRLIPLSPSLPATPVRLCGPAGVRALPSATGGWIAARLC
jgi:hypothetical protein